MVLHVSTPETSVLQLSCAVPSSSLDPLRSQISTMALGRVVVRQKGRRHAPDPRDPIAAEDQGQGGRDRTKG